MHLVGLIIDAVGDVELSELTTVHVRAVHDHVTVTRGLSVATAGQAHRVLALALRAALRQGQVAYNAAVLMPAPSKQLDTRIPLSVSQARRVMAATAGGDLGSRWAFALLYGADQGETLGLEWDRVSSDSVDLSWRRHVLRWRHGCPRPCGRARPAVCPQRVLAIPPGHQVRPLGGSLVLSRSSEGRVLPLIPAMAALLPPAGAGLVWTRHGKPLSSTADTKAWSQLMVDLELPAVPLQAVRHTTAALMLQTGVDPVVIKSILGPVDKIPDLTCRDNAKRSRNWPGCWACSPDRATARAARHTHRQRDQMPRPAAFALRFACR